MSHLRKVDLHLHTLASEGALTESNQFAYAKGHGLSAIAIADRDVLPDSEVCNALAERYMITFVPAVEVTAGWEGYEAHILGYHVDATNHRLTAMLSMIRAAREAHIKIMLHKLEQSGFAVSYNEVRRQTHESACPATLHVARALAEKGFVPSVREAYTDTLLGLDGQCYYPTTTVSAMQAISTIAAAGGIPILAHPALHRRQGFNEAEIEMLRETGLQGIEVQHACHTQSDIERYDAIATRLGLLKTGGTCCRGTNYAPIHNYSVHISEDAFQAICKKSIAA